MARTRTRRLNRFQRRRLRNPLPSDRPVIEVSPDLLAQADEMLRQAVASWPPAANRAYRRWLSGDGKKAPYFLALQVVPSAASHPAVTMPLDQVAKKLLALDDGDPVPAAYGEWATDEAIRQSAAELMGEMAGMREAMQELRETQAAEVQAQVEARQARPPSNESQVGAGRRVELLALLDLSKTPLLAAIRDGDYTAADLTFLSQNLGKVGRASEQSWASGTMTQVRAAINRARVNAQPTARRAKPERSAEEVERETALARFSEAMSEEAGGADEADEDGFESFPEEESRDAGGPGLRGPSGGLGSEGWDPSRMSATTMALGKKIRGSIQREDAGKARLKDFEKYLLKYRRPQARDRSSNLNAPVLYSPPEDVMDKIEEIMEAPSYAEGSRPGMPQQFQDVLVYVLTSDHMVGRSRVIPAGSVEVYNKGTLVGTFGKSAYITNLKKALEYAGTLVGADLQRGVFQSSKASRMRSRILMASQGSEGFRLIAPSLAEVLRATPVEIEIGLDEMYDEGTADFGRRVSNPRRAPVRSIGRTRYVPTSNGYRVLNGKHSGRHYTVNDFGPMCKMALILDHM